MKMLVYIKWLNAETVTERDFETVDAFCWCQAALVRAGLRARLRRRGIALERGVPYLGICLGLQTAVIAAARASWAWRC